MVEHYLLTLLLNSDQYMHAYLMTNDKSLIEGAAERMFDEANAVGGCALPAILMTPLQDEVKIAIVQKLVSAIHPDAAHCIRTATNFHISLFVASPGADKELMKLHHEFHQ
jgi:hypothetical protein